MSDEKAEVKPKAQKKTKKDVEAALRDQVEAQECQIIEMETKLNAYKSQTQTKADADAHNLALAKAQRATPIEVIITPESKASPERRVIAVLEGFSAQYSNCGILMTYSPMCEDGSKDEGVMVSEFLPSSTTVQTRHLMLTDDFVKGFRAEEGDGAKK